MTSQNTKSKRPVLIKNIVNIPLRFRSNIVVVSIILWVPYLETNSEKLLRLGSENRAHLKTSLRNLVQSQTTIANIKVAI